MALTASWLVWLSVIVAGVAVTAVMTGQKLPAATERRVSMPPAVVWALVRPMRRSYRGYVSAAGKATRASRVLPAGREAT